LNDKYHWQVPYTSFNLLRAQYCLDEHPLATAYAGAKWRISALEQQIENIQQAGEKRKSYKPYSFAWVLLIDSSMDSDLQSNITQGRIIPRLVSMFDSVDEMVEENDRRRLDEDLPLENRDQPTSEHVSPHPGQCFFH
jgi:hypothetical protein